MPLTWRDPVRPTRRKGLERAAAVAYILSATAVATRDAIERDTPAFPGGAREKVVATVPRTARTPPVEGVISHETHPASIWVEP